MDEFVTVEINGATYYVGADVVDYLVFEDNYIVNTSSQNITLYGSIREYGNNASGYPRITARPYEKAYIQYSQQSQASTLNVSSYAVTYRKFNDVYLMSVLIFGVLVMMLFRKR